MSKLKTILTNFLMWFTPSDNSSKHCSAGGRNWAIRFERAPKKEKEYAHLHSEWKKIEGRL